jgi:hypothetical protein
MIRWINSRVGEHGIRHIQEIGISEDGKVAVMDVRVGAISKVFATLSRDEEAYLAILLSDLHKRGFLDMKRLRAHIDVSMADTAPQIANILIPCPHRWSVFGDILKCDNCGELSEEL